MSEWLDDFVAPEPAAEPVPTAPAPSPAPPAPPPAPALSPPAVDSATAAVNEIKAIRADRTHPLNPLNHGGDASRREAWDQLYKRAYSPAAAAPALEPLAPAAQDAMDELRDVASRDGHLPAIDGVEISRADFEDFTARVAAVEDSSDEVKRAVNAVMGALHGASSLDPPDAARTEQILRREWGKDFDRKIALAPRAVELLYPDPIEAEQVRDWLDRSGMGDHVALIRAGAELVERHQARRGGRR
jgi:hypothetical protein